jgi:aspartate kinase
MRIVMKFGGTSVGDGERIAHVAGLVADAVNDGHQVVVVVSAMSGVTDALVQAAQTAAQGDAATFRRAKTDLLVRHLVSVNEAVGNGAGLRDQITSSLDNFEQLCHSIYVLGECTPRALDMVSSLGERFSSRILAAALEARGVAAEAIDAAKIVVTDNHFGSANPLMDLTCQQTETRLEPLLEAGTVPVVTGFIGATEDGITTTLGRGGSDYTAAILGRCLHADGVWIWTDVDGVMTADPRVVAEARTLPEISYSEAAELSYFGARVLHPKTIRPAIEQGIPLRIKNTFNPNGPDTLITKESTHDLRPVKAVTAIRKMSIVTVAGRGMLGVPGVAAKVFSAVAHEGISVLMISQSSSEQSICFVVETHSSQRAIDALERAFEGELARQDIDRIIADDDVVIIAVVGAGIRSTPGVAAKVFSALGRNGVNVISIAQGSSEHNLSLVVAEEDADAAVWYIHEEFGLGQDSEQ